MERVVEVRLDEEMNDEVSLIETTGVRRGEGRGREGGKEREEDLVTKKQRH